MEHSGYEIAGRTEASDRRCPVCGERVSGRSDKRFCSDGCRTYYNNRRRELYRLPERCRNELRTIRSAAVNIAAADAKFLLKMLSALCRLCEILTIFALTMRRIFSTLFIAAAALVCCSCVEQSDKYRTLLARLDSLQTDYGTQKNQLDEIFATLNEVENGLSSIRESEHILSVEATKEGVPESKIGRMQHNISAIQNAIEQYRARVEQLKKESDIKSVQFRKRLNAIQKELDEKSAVISQLSLQLAEKDRIIKTQDEKIGNLDRIVSDLQQDITTLNSEGEEMRSKISSQEKQLYSAYYIIGTKEELIKVGVLTRGGLFKSSKVSYQAEKNAFIKIDYREVSTINTNSAKGKVKILSLHPKGTYAVESVNGEYVLTISDPENFWERTKFLVIQIQ